MERSPSPSLLPIFWSQHPSVRREIASAIRIGSRTDTGRSTTPLPTDRSCRWISTGLIQLPRIVPQHGSSTVNRTTRCSKSPQSIILRHRCGTRQTSERLCHQSVPDDYDLMRKSTVPRRTHRSCHGAVPYLAAHERRPGQCPTLRHADAGSHAMCGARVPAPFLGDPAKVVLIVHVSTTVTRLGVARHQFWLMLPSESLPRGLA